MARPPRAFLKGQRRLAATATTARAVAWPRARPSWRQGVVAPEPRAGCASSLAGGRGARERSGAALAGEAKGSAAGRRPACRLGRAPRRRRAAQAVRTSLRQAGPVLPARLRDAGSPRVRSRATLQSCFQRSRHRLGLPATEDSLFLAAASAASSLPRAASCHRSPPRSSPCFAARAAGPAPAEASCQELCARRAGPKALSTNCARRSSASTRSPAHARAASQNRPWAAGAKRAPPCGATVAADPRHAATPRAASPNSERAACVLHVIFIFTHGSPGQAVAQVAREQGH